ncbi:MAG: FKBP-type peptidyl-prolyl cis-trans isomerase [Desulfobacteraceae bacterium]|nr:FKBP-type peptidyl-prolyl cis-trans isomerase [Desulfobacteraceae bacterium]
MDKVKPNCAVTLTYKMKTQLPDDTVKEERQEVVEFILGIERQPPTLEAAIDGACVGAKFSIQIPGSEIYGEHDPGLVTEIPKKGLIAKRLREGRFYRQMKKGSLVSFKVLEIRPDTVLADFNRPMAGVSVLLDGEVTGIREVSEQDIKAASEAQAKKNIGCG